MAVNRWTRNEEIIVFNLYCKISFQRSSKNHPDVIKIANLIGRTPSAVNMKIGNFGSFDDTLKKQGIVGLTNASKLDEEIWNEFNGKWDELAFISEKLIAELQGKKIEETISLENIPLGAERMAKVKQRVNQNFFRRADVLFLLHIILLAALQEYVILNYFQQVTLNLGVIVLRLKRQILETVYV